MKLSTAGRAAVVLLSLLAAVPAPAATHTITQSGFSFSPPALTVAAGDTVNWVWSSGSHTVTSGVNAADPNVGALFDSAFNAANPLFTYVCGEPGPVPYFCRPHVGFGMAGVVTVEAASAVDARPTAASRHLLPNIPNPFNPQTGIRFELAVAGAVALEVHDLTGRRVRTLLTDENRAAGSHRVVWNGRNDAGHAVAAGVYLSVLSVDGRREARRLTLVK